MWTLIRLAVNYLPETIWDLNILRKKAIKSKIEFETQWDHGLVPRQWPLYSIDTIWICVCVEGIMMTYILWNGWLLGVLLSLGDVFIDV